MPLSALSQKTHGNRPRLQANLIGEMSISEARKAKYGDIHDLQEYRYSHFYRCYQGLPGYSRKLLDVEEELREVVQEEISIKEGINTLTKGAKERLRVLDARYFLLKQRQEHLIYGGHILDGICTKPLWTIVLVEKGAVPAGVAAVSTATLTIHASLELDIVLFNVHVVEEHEVALIFLRRTGKRCEKNLVVKRRVVARTGSSESQFGACRW
ncbi:uncharacterized protein N7529_001257 [Penicillium soppii]|uniref:uncharacterized protein n=1 Tax=Penicillium soppii TaxID=69789 RepID=UPI002546DB2A|nr:uncharacterized protein N7529_001257 [Penicillium soppii]KAJ5882585.1 hypothetical protein N7529_001257 [Penicillium soppii]